MRCVLGIGMLIGAAIVSPAKGAQIVQSGSGFYTGSGPTTDMPLFDMFDPALGTLQSVRVSAYSYFMLPQRAVFWTYEGSQILDGNYPEYTLSYRASGMVGVTFDSMDLGSYLADGGLFTGVYKNYLPTFVGVASGSFEHTFVNDLSGFIGNRKVYAGSAVGGPLQVVDYTTLSVSRPDIYYIGGYQGQDWEIREGFDITYNYVAVPELGTWAMMIGGLGLAGVAMRRRSQQASFLRA